MPELGVHLISFISLTFLDCKIVECLWNVACIYKYLQLKGNQYGVAFYLNCIRICKPRKWSPGPPQCVVSQCAHAASVLLPGQEEVLCSNLPPCSEAALPLSVVKATVLAAAHFCEPRVVTWSAGQEDTGKQGSGSSLLKPQAAALSQFHGELQHYCHCCCPCWTQGECTLRSSEESLQRLPSCNYPHVLQKMLVWRECETT